MSNTLRSGETREFAIPSGGSIAISSIAGTVTADVVAGTAKGTNLLSASTGGGTFGPYASGAVVRVTAGVGAIVDYDIGTAPLNNYDQNAKLAFAADGTVAGIADPAGGVIPLPTANRNTIVVIGDSWGARNYSASAGSSAYSDLGIAQWGTALATQRINQINPTAAVGGTVSGDWVNQIATKVAPFAPGWCAVHLGTNDVSGDVAYATTVANLTSIYRQILALGIKLMLFTIPPHGPTYVVAGASLAVKNANRARLNRWICDFAANNQNCFLVDQYSALVNPADTSGYGFAADYETTGTTGLHASASGARKVGAKVAAVFSQFAVDGNLHASSYTDSFDYDAASTNRVSNPMMLGSGGTSTPGAGTTITATVIAASWTVGTLAGTSTTVCTTPARTVALDGDAIGQNQQLVITGAGAADVVSLRTGSLSTRFTEGDTVYAEMYVRVSSAVNLKGVRLLMTTTVGGVTYTTTGMSYSATGFSYDNGDALILAKTPQFTFPTGAISSTLLTLDIAFAGAGGATINAGRASWRKVN